jgi:hypothetical protein
MEFIGLENFETGIKPLLSASYRKLADFHENSQF